MEIKKLLHKFICIPLVLLVICVLAFGLIIPKLGFYHDDWHFIYFYSIHGIQGMVDLFNYDGHPLSVWIYILSFKLVDLNPIAWHVYALIWRWLAVVLFWLLLDRMWPSNKRFTFTAALLFAIYPFFVLQILPISYFEVWISFFLFFLSVYWTVQSIQQPQKFWLFAVLAITAKISQIFTSEYTWGLELLRPLIIWFVLPNYFSIHKKIGKTIKIFLPFLIIFLASAIWRSVLFQAGRKEIAFQSTLFTQPLSVLLDWVRFGFQDMGLILITSWYPILDPAYLDLNNKLNFVLLILIVLSGTGLVLFMNKLLESNNENTPNINYGRQAILIGLLALISGMLPSYAAGYTIYLSAPPGNSRFALAAIPGAALIIAGFLELIIGSIRVRNLLVAILVGLSIGWHVRYTNEFGRLWENQVNFYRQLSWRAPRLKPATAIIATDTIFPKTKYPASRLAISGDYPTSMALNTIYSTGSPTNQIPYWFFQGDTDISTNPSPDIIHGNHLNASFTGQRKNALFLSFSPDKPRCLHIFRANDANYRNYSNSLRAIAQFASLNAINTESDPDFRLLNTIIGPENPNTWCYYYQKADLAVQNMDWNLVSTLWVDAQQKNLTPTNGLELLPFTEALLQLKQWDSALMLTRYAKKLTPNMADVYCPLWNDLTTENLMDYEMEKGLLKARNILNCP